jgi:signal transduction histidine kinase/CheY-like chemotaxis protein
LPMGVLVTYFATKNGWGLPELVQICCLILIFLTSVVKRNSSAHSKAHFVVFLLLVAALADISRYGLMSTTFPLLALLPALSTIIGGLRIGLVTTAITVAALIGLAVITIANTQFMPGPFSEANLSPANWVAHISTLAIAACVAVLVTGSLYEFHQVSGENMRTRDEEIVKNQSRVLQSAKLAGLGYAIVDANWGRCLECDESFARMHGLTVPEMKNLDFNVEYVNRFIHEADREAAFSIRKKLIQDMVASGEFRVTLPNGELRYIRKIFSPLGTPTSKNKLVEVVGQDVSETRKLQDQLFQTQKMDAIGKLTGGVAHDFNNLLAVTLGNLELLDLEVTDPGRKELIKNSISSTLRGAELTRNMLSFARKAPLEPKMVDLNQLVKDIETWIKRTLPSTIVVDTALQAGLLRIKVDPSSAEAGILNLILNARDAMPDGGKLTIETSNVTIESGFQGLNSEDVQPGDYVLLSVSDTGEGISSEDLTRIFEPFYTTKPVGVGSGLGLSMIEGFMQQSSGTVNVHSELGVGTTFELYFKASALADAQISSTTGPIEISGNNSRRTVLVVEDNVDVLATVTATLSKSGYRVLQAISGDAAIAEFGSEANIDLLLTDIVMPGRLQGTMLARELRARHPRLPVVFMSGYADANSIHGSDRQPGDICLMKPVKREDLLRAVGKTLSREQTIKT